MIDLQRFCAKPDIDERVKLHAPFMHKGHTYATNGHLLDQAGAIR